MECRSQICFNRKFLAADYETKSVKICNNLKTNLHIVK